jgi:hypothetical protein
MPTETDPLVALLRLYAREIERLTGDIDREIERLTGDIDRELAGFPKKKRAYVGAKVEALRCFAGDLRTMAAGREGSSHGG